MTTPLPQFDLSLFLEADRALFTVAGPDGYFRRVNPAFQRLLGRSEEQLLKLSIFELVLPADIPKVLAGLATMEQHAEEAEFESRFTHADGRLIWLSWVAKPDAARGVWLASARDVTEFRRLEIAQRESEERLRVAMLAARSGCWEWQAGEPELLLDQSARVLLGPEAPARLALRRALGMASAADRRRVCGELKAARSGSIDFATDWKMADEQQGTRYFAARGRVIERDARGRPLRSVGVLWDVTSQKALEEQLLALVHNDSLTGLRNRRSFDQALRSEWRRGLRSGKALAVLMIDVDNFKQLNDRYGHPDGDECLSAVGRVLMEHVQRAGDVVARYGGEEFVVLLPESDTATALGVGETLRAAVAAAEIPRVSGPERLRVTVSIGVAVLAATPAGKELDLVRLADGALYAAKRQGKDRVCLYKDERTG